MPASRSSDVYRYPWSGAVSQAINPWSWLNDSMGQFGFINVNQTVSSNRGMEREIVEKAAGYGRQLGRISEVLELLVQRLPADEQECKPVREFRDMMNAIAAVKAGHAAPGEESVDRLIAGIRHLRDHDAEAYRDIVEKIRRELPADGMPPMLTQGNKR
jgi:hypothetical protein